jgi:hypothetical protein
MLMGCSPAECVPPVLLHVLYVRCGAVGVLLPPGAVLGRDLVGANLLWGDARPEAAPSLAAFDGSTYLGMPLKNHAPDRFQSCKRTKEHRIKRMDNAKCHMHALEMKQVLIGGLANAA